jgi:hypothetical protein
MSDENYRAQLNEAMAVADVSNAQGDMGRVLLGKLRFRQKYPAYQPNPFEPIDEVELKIKAVCANLEATTSLPAGFSVPQDPASVLALFIPWQAR